MFGDETNTMLSTLVYKSLKVTMIKNYKIVKMLLARPCKEGIIQVTFYSTLIKSVYSLVAALFIIPYQLIQTLF